LVELPNTPADKEEIAGGDNPRTAMKKDRRARVGANESRRDRNAGIDVPKKKKAAALETVVTRKLAQRLKKSRVGKTLGGKAGRRK